MVMTLIVPTRNRPERVGDLISHLDSTIESPGTRVVFAVDYDDPQADVYEKLDLRKGMAIWWGKRLRMNGTLNDRAAFAARMHRGPHDVIGFMGDDHRPHTQGWDEEITRALAVKPGVAYGDDMYRGEDLPTSVFMNNWIIRALGYMAPPHLIHLYMDNFWLALGEETNLTFLPHVKIEHLHPSAGKAMMDAGYLEVNAPAVDTHDRIEFARYMREDWPTEKEKLHGSSIV